MQGIKHLRSGVDSMVRLVEAAGSNIFHKSNIERWDDVCAEFAATNAAIVAATGDLIDVSFRCSIAGAAGTMPLLLKGSLTLKNF